MMNVTNASRRHIFSIHQPAELTPGKALPDGAVTGNGDLSLVWAGTTDRVRLYIGKCDFWKADGRADASVWGGAVPLGLIEVLLPQFPHSPYHVEQDLDNACLTGYYRMGDFDAKLTAIVCAVENTILLELDRTFPGLSVSVGLLPVPGNDAAIESGELGDMRYTVRSFDTPELHFASSGMCVLREVSRVRCGGRETIRWVICVGTNHDSASFRKQTPIRAAVVDTDCYDNLLSRHAEWWKYFWAKSSVSLPDAELEKHWYAGLYTMACCARNKKFPPGLWGNFVTADGMGWFGDYHMNYNFEAPFYALTSSNHTELIDCYMAPLLDYVPYGKKYANEYLGCRGIYYPAAIGPLGLETDVRPATKEHGHLFLGQKSNTAFTAVIPMMHWYGTRDTQYAREYTYPYLREIADFWEDYLVYRDGKYHVYNDTICEVEWWKGPDYIPHGFDEINAIIPVGFVRMLMRLIADMAQALQTDTDRIPKWLDIAENLGPAKTFVKDGKTVLRGTDNTPDLHMLCLRYMFPAEQICKYSTPDLYEAARNSLEQIAAWDNDNLFCEFYPTAARLEYPPDALIEHIHEAIQKHGLPNGLYRFQNGGIENSAAIPGTVNEMLLQSYEHILRLFPCWNHTLDASFHGLRAYGAFVVDGEIRDGIIHAAIFSEKGEKLRLEKPGEGYVVITHDKVMPLQASVTVLETVPGETLIVCQEACCPQVVL